VKRLTVFLFIFALISGMVFAQGIREPQGEELQGINISQAGNEQRNTRQERGNRQERPAQERSNRAENNRQGRADTAVTVSGVLKLQRGFVAVESGDTVYIVPMLNRYIGFINGLSEGTRVTVEGRGFRNVIQPVKVTINDRVYDFPAQNQRPAYGGQNFNRRNENVRSGSRPQQNSHSHNRRGERNRSCCCR